MIQNWILKTKLYGLMTAIVIVPVGFVIGIIYLIYEANLPEGKYTIYAANKTYHADNFQTFGRTIYFRDKHKKNVCITGEYTLIYETEISKE